MEAPLPEGEAVPAVNWPAAALAGLVAGAVVFLLSHGIPWFTSGVVTPTLLGRDLRAPGISNPAGGWEAIAVELMVAICCGLIIAAIVHRVRGLAAVGLGGLIGLGLYGLNFLAFHFLRGVAWAASGEVPVMITHFVFGLFAAGLYKGVAPRRVWSPRRRSRAL